MNQVFEKRLAQFRNKSGQAQRFDALCQRIEAGYANIPENEGLAEIESTVEAERARFRSQRGQP